MHFRPGSSLFDRYPGIPQERRASARQIIEQVAAWHGLTVGDVLGHDRFRHIIEARFDAIAAIRRNHPAISLLRIGRIFSGRDHTTIINALKKRGMR